MAAAPAAWELRSAMLCRGVGAERFPHHFLMDCCRDEACYIWETSLS